MPFEITLKPSDSTAAPETPTNQSPLAQQMNVPGSFPVSGRQWLRSVKITVGDDGGELDVSELRCQFMVRFRDVPQPDWAYVRVTNLAKQTAKWRMAKEFDKLTIEAGYQGRTSVIYKGQVMQKKMGKEPNGTDTYFDIMATGNHQAYGFARMNKTFAAGHTALDVVEEAIKSFKGFGVIAGYIDREQLSKRKFVRAATYFGLTRDKLRHVAMTTNTSWRFHNEEFQMVNADGYLPGQTKIVNSDTGMVGQPEQQINGIVVKMLLDPGIKPGQLLQIDEESIQKSQYSANNMWDPAGAQLQKDQLPEIAADGIYKVYRVDHDGDTHGAAWYTTCTCLSRTDKSIGGGKMQVRSAAPSEFRGTPEEEEAGLLGPAGGRAPT